MTARTNFWNRPTGGQVVLCKFPESERPNIPCEKLRPTILLSAFQVYGEDHYTAVVCYGTGQRVPFSPPYLSTEFIVNESKYFQTFGLVEPTRFDLTRIVELPYTTQWFSPPKNGKSSSPCIGSVPKTLRSKFFEVLENSGLKKYIPTNSRKSDEAK